MNKKSKILLVVFLFSTITFSQWELVNNEKGYRSVAGYDAVDSVIVLRVYKEESLIRVSNNYGENWQEFSCPAIHHLSITKSHKIWGCTAKGDIYSSEGLGHSWIKKYDDPNDTFLNYIKFFDDHNGVCVGDSPDSNSAVLVLTTSDGGNTWESVNDSMGIGDISYSTYYPISFPSKEVGYFDIMKSDELNKTEDGGKTWKETNFPDESVRIMHFYDEKIGYVFSQAFSGFMNIYKTTDGGDNWELRQTKNMKWPMALDIIPEHPEQIWVTDFDNLYYSSNNGKNLEVVNLGTHIDNDPTFIKFVTDKIGYVITDSAHVYKTTNNGGYSLTGLKDNNTIPISFTLHQNYPNPFNPTTNISFNLSLENNVVLEVCDLLGKKISEVYKGNLSAGNYVYKFNGENLSSAIYLIKLKVGEHIQTKKMMLLK